jgi:uncharacterized protein (DUF1501 family)
MISRRDVLRRSTLLSLAPTVPSFVERTVRASSPNRDARILVIIQLDGGNDGINTVVPYKDEGYNKNRREISLASSDLIKLDERAGIGLNPAMRPMGKLFEGGRLAVIHGVGYPNPSRSHFESMAIWQSARTSAESRDGCGWLGRGLDVAPVPTGGGPAAIFLSRSELPLSIRGRKAVATAMTQPGDFTLARGADPRGAGAAGSTSSLTSFIERSALDAYAFADQMAALAQGHSASVIYPRTALAERLRLVAGLIRAGLGTRVYYAIQPGYDTHSVQNARHADLLSDLAAALRAFHDDLAAARLDDRVAVLCFSEFGRRVEENGSRGTDHGTAGPVFLLGSQVRGGLIGTPPSLVDLDPEGDLKMTADFRTIYASVLEDWMEIPSKPVLGGSYEPQALFKA